MIAVSEEQLEQLKQIEKESKNLETLTKLAGQYNKVMEWIYSLNPKRSPLWEENIPKEIGHNYYGYDQGYILSDKIYPNLETDVLRRLSFVFSSIGHGYFAPSRD